MALLNPPILETTMQQVANRPEQAAIRIDLGAIFVSMELSRSSWLITSLSPGGKEKMSKHSLRGGDVARLLELFATLQEKARARTGERFRIIVIQEAGLDGFWIHRVLQGEAIESHVVDAASILCHGGAVGRRQIRSTARLWYGPCWPTSAASRGSAPWSSRRAPRKRIAAESAGSARR
jgi:transposase